MTIHTALLRLIVVGNKVMKITGSVAVGALGDKIGR
jgi:hypothetical protein